MSVAATPALAQPATLPTRDVAITYHLDGSARDLIPGGLPASASVAWSAERQIARVQPEGRPQTLLLSFRKPSLDLIDQVLHAVITLKIRARDLDPVRLQGAKLTRLGVATVAGLECTDWSVASKRGAGTICLTSDGVPLRGAGSVDGREGNFVATSVTYGPIPAASLDIPPGYARFEMPNFAVRP